MIRFGIRISIVIIVNLGMGFISLFSQNCNPPIDNCNADACGGVSIGLITDDNNVFCQGKNVTLKIDKDKTSQLDSFIVYWCDGKVDRFKGDLFEFNHVFDVSENDVCSKSSSSFFVYVVGKKACTDGISCRTIGASISLFHEPRAKFDYSGSICKDKTVNFADISCNVNRSEESNFQWKFHDGTTAIGRNPAKKYTEAGTFPVSLTVTNRCGSNTITQAVQVVDFPDAKVELSANVMDSLICVKDSIRLINRSNSWSNIMWKFPQKELKNSNWQVTDDLLRRDTFSTMRRDSVPFMDTLDIYFINPGTYKFILQSTNVCSTVSWVMNIRVETRPELTWQDPPQFCETAKYRPDARVKLGTVNKFLWTIEGANISTSDKLDPGELIFDKPGNYRLELKAESECDVVSLVKNVVVNSRDPVKILSPAKVYCKNAGPDTLKADRNGGRWSGPGITNTILGVFNPGMLSEGNYRLTYTMGPPGCQSTDTVPISVKNAAFNRLPEIKFCQNGIPVTIQTGLSTAGKWIQTPFLTEDGVFNPSLANIGTTILKYKYPDSNQCDALAEQPVSIEPKPILAPNPNAVVCKTNEVISLDKTFALENARASGNLVYKIDNIVQENNFNLNLFGAGQYRIDISYEKSACKVDTFFLLNIKNKEFLDISNDTSVCLEAANVQLKANPPGGEWVGRQVNSSGLITLNKDNVGINSYIYTYLKGTTCEVKDTVTIEILDGSNEIAIGNNEEKCITGSSYSLSGFSPAGGEWSGQGISKDGTINLANIIPDKTYTYTYCLIENKATECSSCKSKEIIFRSLPNANFDISGQACVNSDINLRARDINTTSTYNYTIADKSVSEKSVENIRLNTSGMYTIHLLVRNKFGCEANSSKTINIQEIPTIDFSLPVKSGCEPFNLQITNNSNNFAETYTWKVGDQIYNSRNLPSIFLSDYDSTTTIKLSLTGKNFCGEKTILDSVKVFPKPKINFGLSELEGCSPLVIAFSNISRGEPNGYSWNLGNGTLSNATNPQNASYFTKDSVTKYTISLTGENQCGKDSFMKEITVFPPDVKAFIEKVKNEYCINDSLIINSFSTRGSVSSWRVTDPTNTEIKFQGNTLKYPLNKAGKYKIYLVAQRCGADEDSITIDVKPNATYNFSVPDNICQKEAIQINATGTNIGTINWTVEGNQIQGSNLNYVFNNQGPLKIYTEIESLQHGCKVRDSITLQINPLPIIAFNPYQVTGCEPLEINLASAISNDSTSYNVLLGNNNLSLGNQGFKITLNAGNYTPMVTATSKFGCVDSSSLSFIKVYEKPLVNFSIEKPLVCLGQDTIILKNLSERTVSQQWLINNNKFNTREISYIPVNAGNQNLKLTGITEFGCKDSLIQNIEVLTPPKSIFTSPSPICLKQNIETQNQSTHASQFLWKINGVNFDTKPNINFLPASAGIYLVSLISNSQNGCKPDTLTREIIVNKTPIVNVQIMDTIICGTPAIFKATNNSTNFDQFNIIINNNIIGSQASLNNITVNTTGTTDIKFVLRNDLGCLDSTSKKVTVFPQPEAYFEMPSFVCENNGTIIQSASTNTNIYKWILSTGQFATGRNLSLNKLPIGEIKITHIAEFNAFCKDTFTSPFTLKVFDSPKANFEYSTNFDNQIIGEVRFNNLSQNFSSLIWDLGDGTNQTLENFMHEYNINRPVEIKLVAVKNHNSIICYDTIIKSISPEWIETFHAPNALSPESGTTDTRVFKPVGLGMKTYKIRIFSPWGQQVWESDKVKDTSPEEYWDGKIKGQIAPQGTYTWMVEIEFESGNKKNLYGNVTLVR